MLEKIGKMDIYLLDQIMKGRVKPNMQILDAGCGDGRNSEFFVRKNFEIYGIDKNKEAIQKAKENSSNWNPGFDPDRFSVADLEKIPFSENHFDFIISSAVLHFSKDRDQFTALFEELIRVLKPNGILFIRMTTKHTLAHLAKHLYDDVYFIPDRSTRYLLDREYLNTLMNKHSLSFFDPFKTVNVNDIRTMAVVVLQKG